MIPEKIIHIIQCPYCFSDKLIDKEHSLDCQNCGLNYPVVNKQLDLRLKKRKTVNIPVTIGNDYQINYAFAPLIKNKKGEVNFTFKKIPKHITEDLLGYFPKAKNDNSLALDIGCGTGIHRSVLESAGYNYIGLDYERSGAVILGDAHALPFKSNSIDFILSMAVLEHIQHPLLFSAEAFRVLKPGGTFIGSVAFLEAFHSHSYYHHTHYGTYNTLENAGFKDIIVAPNPDWSVIKAQAKNIFPRVPIIVSRSIMYPLNFLHKAWWKILKIKRGRKIGENQRVLMMSASFLFIAKKE
jgi:SAM-dependent methyltransferase